VITRVIILDNTHDRSFGLVCLFDNHIVHSELLYASQELPGSPFPFLYQYLACVAVPIYLNISYRCKHFVYRRLHNEELNDL